MLKECNTGTWRRAFQLDPWDLVLRLMGEDGSQSGGCQIRFNVVEGREELFIGATLFRKHCAELMYIVRYM